MHKGVDMKALKEAKRAKLAQLAKENEAHARQQERERKEAAAAATAKVAENRAVMAPPPPRMGPPAPKQHTKQHRTLPAEFFEADKPSPAQAPPVMASPSPSAGLPQGFFDSEPEKDQEGKGGDEGAGLGGLVGYGSDDDDDDDNAGASEPVDARGGTQTTGSPSTEGPGDGAASGEGGADSSSSLPEGFFDDSDADMKARGVEPAEVAAAAEAKEVDEFLAFAAEVGQEAVEEDEGSESQGRESAFRRAAVEQALYMNRLAKLMQSVPDSKDSTLAPGKRIHAANAGGGGGGGGKTGGEGAAVGGEGGVVGGAGGGARGGLENVEAVDFEASEAAPEKAGQQDLAPGSRSVVGGGGQQPTAPPVSAVGEVASLLQGRKKKRKAKALAALEGDYTPLDPADWRAKAV